jgi:hypothetical protein
MRAITISLEGGVLNHTRTVRICACSRVAKARCKTKLKSENKRGVYLNRGHSPWRPGGAARYSTAVLFTPRVARVGPPVGPTATLLGPRSSIA